MKNQNSYYFKTDTRPQVGDIVQTCRSGQGVITSLHDDDTSFTFINTTNGKVYFGNWTQDSDLIERPKELTEVIFRRFKGENKEVIALFPAIAADFNVNNCLSYQNCGQHGAASIDIARNSFKHGIVSFPADTSEKEVSDLFIELTRRGYYLKVVSRFNRGHRIERLKQIV